LRSPLEPSRLIAEAFRLSEGQFEFFRGVAIHFFERGVVAVSRMHLRKISKTPLFEKVRHAAGDLHTATDRQTRRPQ
jgi:glutamate formiminotransferase